MRTRDRQVEAKRPRLSDDEKRRRLEDWRQRQRREIELEVLRLLPLLG